jgi:hypothetical protein
MRNSGDRAADRRAVQDWHVRRLALIVGANDPSPLLRPGSSAVPREFVVATVGRKLDALLWCFRRGGADER